MYAKKRDMQVVTQMHYLKITLTTSLSHSNPLFICSSEFTIPTTRLLIVRNFGTEFIGKESDLIQAQYWFSRFGELPIDAKDSFSRYIIEGLNE